MVEEDKKNICAWMAVMRPGHWIKNGFVAAPLLFSHQFTEEQKCLDTLGAVLCFCAVSSAIYVFNDWCDRQEDSQHPVKKQRPIASGRISGGQAIILSIILMFIGLWSGWYLGVKFFLIVMLYIVINAAYSLGIKHVAILDVMTIAGGFVLRIVGGSVAISVAPSHWLVLCTIMVSMFLGFTKRRAELVAVDFGGGPTRKVLADYSVAFLDQVISMVTGATIICYALYTVDSRTMGVLGSRAMLLTVPSVMYGLFRYIYLIYHLKKGEDPTGVLCRDVPMIINLLIWVVLSILVVSCGGRIDLFD